MSRFARTILFSAVVALLCPMTLQAQFLSELVGFNGSPPEEPIDDPATSQEMFRIPEVSGTTDDYIILNDPNDPYGNNSAYRAAGLQTEGAAALEAIFKWVNPADPDAWLRLSTFNGQDRPNPALHLQGKVRFKITNKSELVQGEIGICIGIRETGENVPQLHNGGTTGDIEWVGVDTTPNGIIAGPDGIVDTAATGDDVQEYPVGYDIINDPNDPLPMGTAVVSVGPNGTLETAPTPDDQIRFGYFIAADGTRTPIPAITLPTSVIPYSLEWNLLTGTVSKDGGAPVGGIAGFTGDGVLSAPPYNRGTLEHVAFTNLPADAATLIDVGIDELQFESPVPDPVLPPTVVAPIIKDDVDVTVTDLMATVDFVSLYLNYGEPPLETRAVSDPNDVIFTITPAVTGQTYTAKQHDSVLNAWSEHSDPVIVLPEAPPYSFSIVIDEDGDNCGYVSGGWEHVPVTSVGTTGGGAYRQPQGLTMFNNNAVWQEIDIPLDDPNFVIAWLGGNGQIDPSPTDLYSIDSMWFTISPGGWIGPHELFIDRIELLDSGDNVLEVINDMENGVNYLERIRGQSNTSATSTALSTQVSYDGLTSHRLVWSYDDPNDPNGDGYDQSLGMYHNIGYTCNTSPQFSDSGAKIRFHILARGAPDPNLPPIPEVLGPIVVGNQDTVRVLNDPNATSVQLYIDGDPNDVSAIDPNGASQIDFTGLSLAPGQSISATQSIGRADSDFAYPQGVSAKPIPPVVQSPIPPGSQSVWLTGIYDYPFATASLVTVYVNGDPHGTADPGGGEGVLVNLDVTLATGNLVTATQEVNTAISDQSEAVTVAYTAPVLYKAPAENDPNVLVIAVEPTATSVTVVLNGTTEFTESPDPNSDRWDVAVSGLTAGDTITAYYTVGAVDSVESDYETVTTNVPTSVLACDHFPYADQTAMEVVWTQGGTVPVELATDKDATCPPPAGTNSSKTPPGNSWMLQSIPQTVPTETEPLVFNISIYDPIGPDPAGLIVQWAELNYIGGPDWFYMHIGMLGWADTDNVHYDFRFVGNGGPNWVDLDEYDGPERSVGWHNFTMAHKGNRIDVYVDGQLAVKNLQLSAETTYARTEIGGGDWGNAVDIWFDDLCIETGPVHYGCITPQPPGEPAIAGPIEAGDMSVTVTNLSRIAGQVDDVTLVEIIDQGSNLIGSYAGPFDPNTGEATVPLLRALVHLERITAEATNVIGTTASDPLEVGIGNGDILVCIGIRETGDTGPLGSEGSGTGDIEWIGAGSALNGAPQGVAISPSDDWQTRTFDPIAGPVTGFTGNGTIDVTRGTLEHLAVAVNAASPDRSTGRYELYVDNVVNVGAGDGGSDFVLTDFEGYAVGTEVLFQEPTYSGTTDLHLTPLPSASEASDAYGNPGQSELLVWFWVDTTDQRWARIVTSAASQVPSPIIDLTQPIRMDLLLVVPSAGCPNPGDSGNYCLADISPNNDDGLWDYAVDGDCVVGLTDLAQLLAHYGMTTGATREDGDISGPEGVSDGAVGLNDLAELLGQYLDDCN